VGVTQDDVAGIDGSIAAAGWHIDIDGMMAPRFLATRRSQNISKIHSGILVCQWQIPAKMTPRGTAI
jgi:hypothetical protein